MKKGHNKVVDFGMRPFEELRTSTSTVMMYTNVIFNPEVIFKNIKLTEVDVPLTKKQKKIDKKNLEAPYGAILSVQSKTEIRGLNLRKKKKKWCTICSLIVMKGNKKQKVYTVTERIERNAGTDVLSILYDCSYCQTTYHPHQFGKISHFLNQLTIITSIGTKPFLNIMMFRDNIKFAGCKDPDDAVEAMIMLWQDYITKIPGAWSLKKGATKPKFIIDVVMRNVDFKLGFPIQRKNLNMLMNEECFSEHIFMSQYESTAHTNVNIKMYSVKPIDFKYDCLVIPLDDEPYFITVSDLIYKKDKKKDLKQKYITFIVFSSSEIILSGKYNQNMKDMYEFFINIVFTHRKEIEEFTMAPDAQEIKKIFRLTQN